MTESSKRISRSSWAYWLKMAKWSLEETTLILIGVIPVELTDYFPPSQDGVFPGRTVRMIEIYAAEEYLDLIKRNFAKEGVNPKDFIIWCKNFHMPLDAELVNEIVKLKFFESKLSDFLLIKSPDSTFNVARDNVSDEDSPKYFEQKRRDILVAAFQHLGSLSRDTVGEYFKPSGGINIQKLSEELNDLRHQFPQLTENSRGTSLENIKKTLRNLLSED